MNAVWYNPQGRPRDNLATGPKSAVAPVVSIVLANHSLSGDTAEKSTASFSHSRDFLPSCLIRRDAG